MRIKLLMALVMLGATAPLAAEEINLGDLSVPGFRVFGNTLGGPATYVDTFTFNIDKAAGTSALLGGIDIFNPLDIVINSVELLGVGSFLGGGFINFGAISQGEHKLIVTSTVTGRWGRSISYAGLLTLLPSKVSSVPEPGTMAMYGFGLLAVAFASRRRLLAGRSA